MHKSAMIVEVLVSVARLEYIHTIEFRIGGLGDVWNKAFAFGVRCRIGIGSGGNSSIRAGLGRRKLVRQRIRPRVWPQDEFADVSGDLVDFLKANGGFLTSDVQYKTGYVIGVAVGYAITPNIAMELEYAYRNADTTFSSELSDGVDVFT